MKDTQSRILLYGSAFCATVALSWFGFVREVDADYGTLVGSAEMHAQMAMRIPADVESENLLAQRNELLEQTEDLLRRAEAQVPNGTEIAQLRGWMASYQGQHEAAAGYYEAARQGEGADASNRRRLGEFAARAWSNAEQFDRALAMLDEDHSQRSGEERWTADLLRARILHRMGNTDPARAVALEVGSSAELDSAIAREAVRTLRGLGAFAEASTVCDRAWSDVAVREYQRSVLKLHQGNADSAVRLLMSAIEQGRPQVTELLEQDRELWVEATGEQAIGDFLGETPAPASPAGR